MSTTDIRAREMIIDRCLRRRQGVTVNELMERVNRALESEMRPTVSSNNTIMGDLINIGNQWKTVIEKRRCGRTIRYLYRDPTFSIYNGQLTYGELKLLHDALLESMKHTKFRKNQDVKELESHLRQMIDLP